MALPKLLREIFENDGAGPKFRADKIPVTQVTVDSALSATSENPVQNKVINSALDGKLSTSGGTVSGSTTINYVSFPSSGIIKTTSTNTELLLNYGQGAWLSLLGVDFPREDKGAFILQANAEGVNGKQLKGLPDGSLRWCEHDVITVVAQSYGGNSWYRKYSDGWIEQGGTSGTPDGQGSSVITFPIAFSNAEYTITFCNNMGYHAWLSDKTTTNFAYSREQHTGGMGIWWYACGK